MCQNAFKGTLGATTAIQCSFWGVLETARSVLGWETAWEALGVLLAFDNRTSSDAADHVMSRYVVASGHTLSKTPGLIRTRKLSLRRLGQYWGGRPPGKPLGCCWLLTTARQAMQRIM